MRGSLVSTKSAHLNLPTKNKEIDVDLNHLSQNHVIVNFAHKSDGETQRKALLTTFLAAFSVRPGAGMDRDPHCGQKLKSRMSHRKI